MRKITAILFACGAAAGVVLLIASIGVGRGGGGHGGSAGHIGSFSSGSHFSGHMGGYPGGYIGGSHISEFHPGAGFQSHEFTGNRVLSHPGGYSVAHPGAWQARSFSTWPGRVGVYNPWTGWGNRYGVRYPYYSSWYHGNWYDHGHRWWNFGPVGWWWGSGLYDWGLGGYAAPWSWGYYPYYNPYCVLGSGATVYDYTQPLILAERSADATAVDEATGLNTAEQESLRLLNLAKDAFRQGDYDGALTQINAAVKLVPEDRILHEFRGLVLFALGRYQESAAAVYAVLAAGPGWDWTTLSGLYANVDTYTKQLRTLEKYAIEHPQAGDAFFLLGYQYLACGHADAAAAQFANAAKVNSKDRLSSQLALALKQGDQNAPVAAEAVPAGPVHAASLVGDWTAKRPDGVAIGLKLTADNKFTWKVEAQDKPREFSGAYSLSDNLLVFKQGEKPMMVGQVKPLNGGGFNFRIVGDTPSDPGLNFVK